jgi:hypothetical protein
VRLEVSLKAFPRALHSELRSSIAGCAIRRLTKVTVADASPPH